MSDRYNQTRCRLRNAFTLLELAVVVAIVGVLASLALAGVQRVRAAAARVTCANNMRQVGQAMANASAQDAAKTIRATWNDSLLPYLELDGLRHVSLGERQTTFVRGLVCPAEPATPGESGAFLGNYARSFWLDDCSLGNRESVPDGFSHTVLAAEQFGASPWAWWPTTGGLLLHGRTLHAGGCNTLFCDGHVTWLAAERTPDDQAQLLMDPNDGKTVACDH